jgi:putative addiction module component (TIGR02574 family)
MILDRHPELRQLSQVEKLELATELWDEVEADQASLPISEEHMAELDRRNEEYERDPSRVTTWEAIKARLLGGHSTP